MREINLDHFLKDAIRIDQSNIRLASLSAFVSNQYEEKRLLSVLYRPHELDKNL